MAQETAMQNEGQHEGPPAAQESRRTSEEVPSARTTPLGSAVSRVLEIPPASPEGVKAHFGLRLHFETDPADVRHDQERGVKGFVVLDVRPRNGYDEGHVPGARSMPYATIDHETVADWDKDTLYVTYGWSAHCNAGTKAGYLLGDLGFRVKEMIGGYAAWQAEGYPTE